MNERCPLIFGETWRPITKLSVPKVKENMYFVSDRGRVISRSIHRKEERILSLVETNNGYFRVGLRHDDGEFRYYLIHRIVMIEFNPVYNFQNLQVNHIDGIKSNNCIWNLEWVTCKENIIHAYKTGLKTQYRGEQCSYATITNAQAEQIAKLLITKQYSHEQIANIVGCHTNIVRSISSGSTWIDIYNKYNLENYKKEFVLRLSDEDLHKLFKYFQDHKNINYKYKSELYRNALMELFGIEMKQSMTATLSRLHNRVTRTDISSQYDF